MEKVWKKVNIGLSSKKSASKTSNTDTGYGFGEPQNVVAVAQIPPLQSSSVERRRRRRRKSRPRRDGAASSKTEQRHEHFPLPPVPATSLRQRALAHLKIFNFHLNWDLQMSHCKPCGSKPGNIITRRLSKKRDMENELYRSNSFKFERFERKEDSDMHGDVRQRQISVCDDYSLPIDFVKKRPSSFDPCLADSLADPWNKSSPLSEHVAFIDHFQQIDPGKLPEHLTLTESQHFLRQQGPGTQRKPSLLPEELDVNFKILKAEDIFDPCSDSSAPPKSSEDEEDPSSRVNELNSPDSISEDIFPSFAGSFKSPKRLTVTAESIKRNPSPYYYADLLKKEEGANIEKANSLVGKSKEGPVPYRKSNSLDTPGTEKEDCEFKRYSVTEAGVRIIRCDSASSTTSENSNCSECKKRRNWHAKELAKVRATCNVQVKEQACGDPEAPQSPEGSRNVSNEASEDMNCKREIYETAFDSKVVVPSENDIDDVEKIARNAHLFPLATDDVMVTPVCPGRAKRPSESKKSKNSKNQAKQGATNTTQGLSQDLDNLCLQETAKVESSSALPLRGYTPTPPSTAPLPLKFPLKHERFFINSIKSAPNLPSSNPAVHPRLQSLRMGDKENTGTSDQSIIMDSSYNSPKKMDRPRSVAEAGRVGELKRSHNPKGRGKNFSSTESITSSAGSMDSLRSSTSEGNRSTTSTESRQSSSLSSHESDSGANVLYPLRTQALIHTKLHILSPISDKSSLEPGSETSDLNKGASQKQTPVEERQEDTDTAKQRKKLFPNKTLLGIANVEIQGSDSGISIHSGKDDMKSKLPLLNYETQKHLENKGENSSICLPQDVKDLPFDMPKLRRRRVPPEQDACTSGSATSVDLGELPFDMPKLRRRLRLTQVQSGPGVALTSTESSCVSQASSSQSVRDDKLRMGSGTLRQTLTLNLNDQKTAAAKKFGTLDGNVLNLNLKTGFKRGGDVIEVNLPLERQNWYHGAISRVEAESVLKKLNEGSFLVRNSESTRQDYSLSLKSARGFMHMRIQRNSDTSKFILGQFSRPFDSIPEMIQHFCLNRLPVRGAEHMCLIEPVVAQIL